MAKVYNWQIGREMAYPYEGKRPEKQFAMIFDANKCIACQTCTVACKTTWTPGRGQEYMYWNNVETKPYGYYPLGWDVNILDRLGVQEMTGPVYDGKTLFDAAPQGEIILGYLPEDLDYAHPNIGEDDSTGLMPQGAHLTLPHMQWMFYLPRICNHCTYPACLSACPRQSIYKRPGDGIVLLDQSRCRGYRECVKGCPYKKVYFNAQTRVSEKCIGCYPAVEGGRQTQCTISCIGKIRIQGFMSTPDKIDEDNPLDYLVFVKKIALPLYPQFGLEPNTYYIPSRPSSSARCSASAPNRPSRRTGRQRRTRSSSARSRCSGPRPRSRATSGWTATRSSATTPSRPRSYACRSGSPS